GAEFVQRVRAQVAELYPDEPNGWICDAYLWARTVICPYCGGTVPLSPNWRLSSSGHGVRLVPEDGRVRFEVVEKEAQHSHGTVKGGEGTCPFPECRRTIDGDEIKAQAQAGKMGHQMYCVVYKEERIKGYTKAGKPRYEKVRGFRAPRPEDDVEALVRKKLEEKMPLWQARNVVPDEEIPFGYDTMIRWPLDKYGLKRWTDMFSVRQLYGHCVSTEVFQDLVADCVKTERDRAAMAYLAVALDKMVDYNSLGLSWHATREVLEHTFRMHSFSFKWSYAEMAPTIPGLGYDWVVKQVGKCVGELIELLGQSSGSGKLSFTAPRPKPEVRITCASADLLPVEDATVDCVVMDPPYYDNVMYAELSDFFYVWLKRTAGLLYPELFALHLTDKDREAVANPSKFFNQKRPKDLARLDYQNRMASIFKEQRRVLKPDGIMTVMFTHKATGAWDALAAGLTEAGFTITASWPVNTEAEASLHIREKSAARSTIFLVCRVRESSSA